MSFNEPFSQENFKVCNKVRNVNLLPVLWELDTTLTPSVGGKQLRAHLTAVHIQFINDVLPELETVPASDTLQHEKIRVGMKNTASEQFTLFVFPTPNCQNKQKRGFNQNMN